MIPGFFRFPAVLKPVYGNAIYRLKQGGNKVYLSFDDGPTSRGTREIISVLKKNGVNHAVFFCTGSNIEKYPGSFSEIKSNGFTVANHGYLHLDGWKTARKNYIDNCTKGSEITNSLFFRPPYGHMMPGQYNILKKTHRIVFWDLLLYDWDMSVNSDTIIGKIRKLVRPGSVIALHDRENMCALRVLDDIIDICKSRGFTFGDLTVEAI